VGEIVYATNVVDRIEIAKIAKIAKNRRDWYLATRSEAGPCKDDKNAKSMRNVEASLCDLCVRCG
jgi:hypothetical protein